MPRKTDGLSRLQKVLSIEPQLGLVLFLISVPIVFGLIAFGLLTGALMVQAILNPWRDPIPAIFSMVYTIWGVVVIRGALRGSPDPDRDGYVRRPH